MATADDYRAVYTHDLTGNRVKKTVDTGNNGSIDESIVYTFDANDRMLTESLDTGNNGTVDQTTTYGYTGTQQSSKTVTPASASFASSAVNYSYDLQGRMNAVTITARNPSTGVVTRTDTIGYRYGTDGIRISARQDVTQNGVTTTEITSYLIDAANHTGYQQVLEETVTDGNGNLLKKIVYTIGHDHISQTTFTPGGPAQGTTAVFHMDGHGSTRILTDLAGTVVTVAGLAQVFHYDAYGNAINFNMSQVATQYLYSGEQFDARIQQQYLRARYFNQANGTFSRLDPFSGNLNDPQSLNKYLYTHANPVSGIDPTGNMNAATSLGGLGMLGSMFATASTYLAIATPYLVYGGLALLGAYALYAVIIAAIGWYAAYELGLLAKAVEAEAEEMLGSTGENIRRIGETLKAHAEAIAKTVAETLKKIGQTLAKAPIFYDVELTWPEPYSLDVKALSANPALFALTYFKRSETDSDRLRADLATAHPRPANRPFPQYHMHEFPFNKTGQASVATSYVEYVNGVQNSLQGVYFSWFIRKRLKSVDNAPFIVIPIPDIVTPLL